MKSVRHYRLGLRLFSFAAFVIVLLSALGAGEPWAM
jgi:hypothetical protein